MTYSEFRHHLAKAGITAREFAELVGLSPNSITNQAKNGVVASLHAVIVTLMAEMTANNINFRAVLMSVKRAPNKPRGSAARGKFGGSKQMSLDLPEDD